MVNGPGNFNLKTMERTNRDIRDNTQVVLTTTATITNDNYNTTTTVNYVSSNYNNSLMLVVLALVGTILFILILFIGIFFGRKLIRHCRRIKCHVCLEKVDKRSWESNHRPECQKKNFELLRNLPEPFDIRCPHCLAYLKLMPKVNKTGLNLIKTVVRFFFAVYYFLRCVSSLFIKEENMHQTISIILNARI